MKKIVLLLFVAVLLYGCGETEELVVIHTDQGDIKIRLYDETPQHKANFIKLVNEKYYDGSLFHRCIKDFMIQGGDPDSKTATPGQMLGNGGPGYTVPAEFVDKYFHKKGALAAARMGDNVNPKKESSGSQFYLVQGKKYTDAELDMIQQSSGKTYTPEQRNIYKTIGGTPFLDHGYTVFGEVVEGLDVIDKIAALHCDQSNRPQTDVKMTMEIIKQKKTSE